MARSNIPHAYCKGICKKYVVKKPSTGTRYSQGQKRCQMCLVFINYESSRCPCCSYLLRTRSRSKTSKQKHEEISRI